MLTASAISPAEQRAGLVLLRCLRRYRESEREWGRLHPRTLMWAGVLERAERKYDQLFEPDDAPECEGSDCLHVLRGYEDFPTEEARV